MLNAGSVVGGSGASASAHGAIAGAREGAVGAREGAGVVRAAAHLVALVRFHVVRASGTEDAGRRQGWGDSRREEGSAGTIGLGTASELMGRLMTCR